MMEGMEGFETQGAVVWHPVHPELTQVRSVQSTTFEYPPDTLYDGYAEDELHPILDGNTEVWPSVHVELIADGPVLGRNAPEGPRFVTIHTGLHFTNVALWNFQRFVIGEKVIDELMGSGGQAFYDNRPLRDQSHFQFDDREPRLSTIGGFGLWECPDSPLTRRLAEGWRSRIATLEEKQRVLSHYKLTCDEYGTIHAICTDLRVERLA